MTKTPKKEDFPFTQKLSFDGTAIKIFSYDKIVHVPNPNVVIFSFKDIPNLRMQIAKHGNGIYKPFTTNDFECIIAGHKERHYEYKHPYHENCCHVLIVLTDTIKHRPKGWQALKPLEQFSLAYKQTHPHIRTN